MKDADEKSTLKTMLVPIGIALLFIAWGLLVFFTVGDKMIKSWDFGIVPDVPGSSPYAVERKGRADAAVPQHIDGGGAGTGLADEQKEAGDDPP